MLKIEAIVRPERIAQVADAMLSAGCSGFHYQNVTGQGQQQGVTVVTGRGAQVSTRSAVPKTLLTAVIPDNLKEAVVESIIGAARTPNDGQIGDGKIFVSEVSDVVRVRTGEKGQDAI